MTMKRYLMRFVSWLDSTVFRHRFVWLCDRVWDWQLDHEPLPEWLVKLQWTSQDEKEQ